MQDILATYLFQHRNCPLPGIGSLQLKEASATVLPGEQKITATAPSIYLTNQDISANGLIGYIASEKDISIDEAQSSLKQYCRTLKYMGAHEEVTLTEAGTFSISPDGKLVFKPVQIDPVFQPTVHAEKVIRPNDTHSMLVGDTETTNTVMNEYYNNDSSETRNRWWIWAIVIAAVSIVAVVIYLNTDNKNGRSGNGINITPSSATDTYKKAN